MFHVRHSIALCVMAFCLCILVACSSLDNPTTSSGSTPTSNATTSTGTTVVGTSVPSTPGVGPSVILTPTPIPGGGAHSQQVVLADRTLIINDVSKGTGTNAGSTAISMTMTLKNTSAKTITNSSSYFSLFGAEGDAFGLPANTTSSFFGPINANNSRTGTIVFQVPTAATKALKLFYRSEVASETVFVPFSV